MKIGSAFPLLLILVLSFLVASISSAAIAPQHGPSARGAGQFLEPGVGRWQFSFEAIANKNGRARGRAEFDNLTTQTQIDIRIDCLRVHTSEALITGIVLHSDDVDLPKGTNVEFAAVDGDLVSATFPDIITPVFPNSDPEGGCQNASPPLTMFQLPRDAIQIEP